MYNRSIFSVLLYFCTIGSFKYPDMEKDNSLTPYEVFDGTAWEAGLLKSMLEDNDIETILKDASFAPWNLFPVRSGSVKVFVALRDLENARNIVKEFYTNMQKETTDEVEE